MSMLAALPINNLNPLPAADIVNASKQTSQTSYTQLCQAY